MDLIKKMKPRYYVIYSLVIVLGIVIDQISKLIVVKFLKPIDDFPLWEGVFHLNYHENRGAAFGMLADNRWVFIVISTVAILGMGLYLFFGRANSTLMGISMALIISGGIGNMIDRLALEYVVDFLYFKLIDFAIFNIADSFVCIGAALMVLALILEIVEESKKSGKKGEKNDVQG